MWLGQALSRGLPHFRVAALADSRSPGACPRGQGETPASPWFSHWVGEGTVITSAPKLSFPFLILKKLSVFIRSVLLPTSFICSL